MTFNHGVRSSTLRWVTNSFSRMRKRIDFAEKCRIILTSRRYCDIISRLKDLGVAQLVARYLGVVEAASSSLVTQTK